MVTPEENISADYPFTSHFIEVNGSNIHYIDEGEGDPIVFLHGNPTWSYLWRNIIPHLTKKGRCIAPDLIGMGKSDKPEIEYRLVDHISYIDAFIEKLGLENITLVIHDWGSAIGFHYAMHHEHKIKALVFMESIVSTVKKWDDMPSAIRFYFKLFRSPIFGKFLIQYLNLFTGYVLSRSIIRKLSPEEKAAYKMPYPTVKSLKPIYRWPNEVPIEGHPPDVDEIVSEYHNWLQETELPKLLFSAKPGAIMPKFVIKWCQEHMKNLKTVELGKGLHYLQEDHPTKIGKEISLFLEELG